ncbi:potassium/proton antiporter [Nitriliruptoraceae bacterium ZYF776]|nr:potassium/proton antiporter [Profundirhabdus halotolerans]
MTVGLSIDPVVLVASALLGLAVLVAGLTHQLRAPSALLFLGLGMLVGDDGLGVVTLDDTSLVQNVSVIALLVILFEGGLTTKPTDLRRAAAPGGLLATLGVALTAAVTGLGAWLVLDIEPLTAALLGAVVASTDAAAVFSTLRQVRLPWRLAAILKVESGANDPLAVVLTLGLVEVWARTPTGGELALFALLQPVVGAIVGLVVGYLGALLLRKVRLPADGLYPVAALAVAGVAYGGAVTLRGSGFLAVYVSGLLVGALVRRRRRGIRDFHEGLANAAEIGLFLVLGLLVFPSRLPEVWAAGLLLAGVLTFVARPLATVLCLAPFRVPWREQLVVAWGGLRGAVPIVLATFPITAGHPEGRVLFDVVFFVVLVSTLVQGTTVGKLVSWLGIPGARPAWAPVAEALPIDEVEADLVEVIVADDLPIAGRQLRDVPLPAGMLLAAIVRDERVVVPRGDAHLLDRDVLLVVVQDPDRAAERVTSWARSEPSPPSASRPSSEPSPNYGAPGGRPRTDEAPPG